MISIAIPSIKKEEELSQQIQEIKNSFVDSAFVSWEGQDYEIVTSCCKQSSSLNRNACLEKSKGEHVIFVDDDIRNYYKGWAHELISPLQADDNIKIVSARLMTPNGTPATMISFRGNIDLKQSIWVNPDHLLPSACIAFARDTWQKTKENPKLPNNIPFDNNYILANAEDADFCMAVKKTFPESKMVVNTKVKITHLSNEVWRTNNPEDWKQNHRLFEKKWGRPPH